MAQCRNVCLGRHASLRFEPIRAAFHQVDEAQPIPKLLEVGKRQTEMASSKRKSPKKLLTAQDLNGYLPITRKDRTPCHGKRSLMPDTRHQVAGTIFERTQRREKEINDALKQEYARRETAITNMHRLRALRLERGKRVISQDG